MLSILLAVAVAQWQPLDRALPEAQQNGRLVAVYMESGIPNQDSRATAWIADALTHTAVQESIDSMVTARVDYASPLLHEYEELRVIAKNRAPHFVIVDPAGGVVTELTAFGDVRVFAGSLVAINGEKRAFLNSAQARMEGALAQSYFYRGLGLSKAGAMKPARTAFSFAESVAKRSNDGVVEQRARLGLAAINLDAGFTRENAFAELLDIAKHPKAPDIGANAWILVGHERKSLRDPNGAIEAYQNAYRLVPPSSDVAVSARHYLELLGVNVESDARSGGADVHLIFSRRPVIAGNLDVGAVAPEETARVEYFVDGARVADSGRRPFRSTLRLGSAPRLHELKVIARDRNGAVLGAETVVINDHPDRLSVQIVSPRGESVEERAVVEAAVRAPDGVRVETVDFFWNDRKLATLSSQPLRYELVLPSRGASGYIRVVARDSTGATAEDAKLINGSSVAEDLRIDAVDLYAIVHDRSGRIVEGLTAQDFVVKEDGVPVAVTLRSTSADPITVGLALDTSASMRPVMLDVAEFATAFVRDSLTPGDRTLVVTFDSQPHLAQPLTGDLQHVSTSFAGAEARGGTAIWDAIAYALRQLPASTGKRSLLVFTDGIDNGSSTPPTGALAVAQETGVAVYIVLMNRTAEGERRLFGPRLTALETITRETGGAIVNGPRRNDLPELFTRVRDDTRGEYILSFVSKSTKPRSSLRKLSVAVPNRGFTVRATTGYYPQ